MKLIKKNNEEVYQVADGSWFEQYTEVISEPDDNGSVYDFFEENVKATDVEEEYKEWQKEHFDDYYFAVAQSKQGDFYAVAYESGDRAAFACEIENPNFVDKLTLSKCFDTIAKNGDDIILFRGRDSYDGVFGSDLCAWDIRIKDDNDVLCVPNEQLNYSSAYLEDMFEVVSPGDEDDETIYMESEYECESIPVRKLTEIPSDIKQQFVDITHGIRTDEVCITDAEVTEGEVYQAPNYTPQNYPTQEYEDAFMFVDDKGKATFLRRTMPFYTDESRDIFEEITRADFMEFCD